MKTEQDKTALLEQLKKTPLVQIACEKTGIGRATYYRWRKEDPTFTGAADAALKEGSLLINDLAESQLIGAIKDRNLGAITLWLKSHHPAYSSKVELSGTVEVENYDISPEQQAMITKALSLVGLIGD